MKRVTARGISFVLEENDRVELSSFLVVFVSVVDSELEGVVSAASLFSLVCSVYLRK